jgi:hypothetical protein
MKKTLVLSLILGAFAPPVPAKALQPLSARDKVIFSILGPSWVWNDKINDYRWVAVSQPEQEQACNDAMANLDEIISQRNAGVARRWLEKKYPKKLIDQVYRHPYETSYSYASRCLGDKCHNPLTSEFTPCRLGGPRENVPDRLLKELKRKGIES